jgi:hypothetical protein
MISSPTRLACALALGIACVMPCRADSLASSASSAGSASIGSLSDSIRGSSDSSNNKNNKLAEGDYRIIEVAAIAQRPGMLRLKMQAAAREDAEGELYLDLPRQALGAQGLAAGDVVSARQRPYGFEFARAETREPFFLVLADDWRRDLDPRPVSF